MSLTTVQIRNAKPKAKPYRLADEKGLVLFVNPNGTKYWRVRYRWLGKEKTLSLGPYPEISLKEARGMLYEARKQLREGIDPSAEKQQKKFQVQISQENNFEAISLNWYEQHKSQWTEKTQERAWRNMQKDLNPFIGSRPIADITPQEMLAVIRRVEARGALHTAKRVKQTASQVFRYAVACGLCTLDPTRDLAAALKPEKKEHLPAIVEPDEVGELLRTLDGYQGSPVVRAALQLAPLTFVRPGELRRAEWEEINLEKALWTIPAEKMKMRVDHIVPLSRQAVAVLEDIQCLTGRGKYVFPSHRGQTRPMSDNAVLAAMRSLGIPKEQMVGHGFRAMARTLLDEVLDFRVDFIEQQLAHAVRDPNGRAYNRTKHLTQRTEMMQRWADYLDELRAAKS